MILMKFAAACGYRVPVIFKGTKPDGVAPTDCAQVFHRIPPILLWMKVEQNSPVRLTVVASTNRPDAVSTRIAELYLKMAQEQGVRAELLRMDELPHGFVEAAWDGGSSAFDQLVHKHIVEADKLVFIVPEYNGSYPGILKAFIDAAPQSAFYGKKAGIIGVSSGRAGNLRGADQLTNVLNYLRISVYYRKPKLSGIHEIWKEGEAPSRALIAELRDHLKGVLEF